MNFLGMGPGELVLIATLGLIIFGPGKLPEITAQLGRAVRDFRRSTSEITAEFQRSFSLEEPSPPAEAPAAPAAEPAPAASEPAPVVADASTWHWETSEASPPPASAASSATTTTSFWQWDEPERAAAEDAPAAPPAPAPSAIWVWDAGRDGAVEHDGRADEGAEVARRGDGPAERAATVEVPPAG